MKRASACHKGRRKYPLELLKHKSTHIPARAFVALAKADNLAAELGLLPVYLRNFPYIILVQGEEDGIFISLFGQNLLMTLEELKRDFESANIKHVHF